MIGSRGFIAAVVAAAVLLLPAGALAGPATLRSIVRHGDGTIVGGGTQAPAPAASWPFACDAAGCKRLPARIPGGTVSAGVAQGDDIVYVGEQGSGASATTVAWSVSAGRLRSSERCGKDGFRELALGGTRFGARFASGPSAAGAVMVGGAAVADVTEAMLLSLDFASCAIRPGVGPDGRGWITMELGRPDQRDILLGSTDAGNGTLIVFGSDGGTGASARAAIAQIDAATWTPIRVRQVDLSPERSDLFVAASVAGGVLTAVGPAGQVNCFSATDLGDAACAAPSADFGSCGESFVTAGAPNPGTPGSLFLTGACGHTDDWSHGLLAIGPGGAVESGFGTGGRQIYDVGSTLFPFANVLAVDSAGIMAAGDLFDRVGAAAPFTLRTDHSGGAPRLDRIDVPADPPVMERQDGSPGVSPPAIAGPGSSSASGRCECSRLEAAIVPGSVTTRTAKGKADLDLRLTWKMTCSSGAGGCDGSLALRAPRKPRFSPRRPSGAAVTCKGDCSRPQTRNARFTFRTAAKGFGPARRRGRTFKMALDRVCQGRRLPAVTFSLAFDRKGSIDRRKSDLDGDGRPDGQAKKPK